MINPKRYIYTPTNLFEIMNFSGKSPMAMAAILSGVAVCPSFAQTIFTKKANNVILIMTDQQRFDCIGTVNDKIKTPNIDALAADGILFKNAYVASPSSTPARSVLLTGMTPWHTGMIGYNGRVGEKYPNEMPRMLAESGYTTIGIGKMHWFPQRNGHGFQTLILDESGRVESDGFVSDYRQWFDKEVPGLNPDSTGVDWNAHRGKVYALPERLHPTRWTGDVTVEQIQKHDTSKPLFLKVSFARPHSPYDPPQRYLDMYKDVDIPAPWIGDWCDQFADYPNTETAPYGDFSVEHAINSRRHYYASITFIDDEIGRIISELKAKGMYDNSLIIFTSDHGDMLGDHHHWRKTYAYEGSTHIPFIMKAPDSRSAGQIREQCVGLRDILPTFLEVAGGVVISKDIDGNSLMRLVDDPLGSWRQYIEMEHSSCYRPNSGWVALTDGKIKYVWFYNSGEEQMFDLVTDPQELHSVAKEEKSADALTLWRGRMAKTLAERGDEWVKDGVLQVNQVTSPLNDNYPK